jgi:hypothetical protein
MTNSSENAKEIGMKLKNCTTPTVPGRNTQDFLFINLTEGNTVLDSL